MILFLQQTLNELANTITAIRHPDYVENAIELFDPSDVAALARAAKTVAAVDRFEATKSEARRLRYERADLHCERAEPDPEEAGADDHITGYFPAPPEQDQPCWKKYSEPGRYLDDRPTTEPQEAWCEPCRRRQAVHEQYRLAVKARGAAERALLRIAKGNR